MNLEEAKKLLEVISLENIESVRERNFRIAGIITEYVRTKIGVELIIVGGLSVEVYTEGGYMTNDIDFVGANHLSIMECLEELGFEHPSKYNKNILGGSVMRFHGKLNVLVEVPSEILKDADINRVKKVLTPDNLAVYLIGIEDIIADRIRAATHYKETRHHVFILDMIKRNNDKIDYVYLYNSLIEEEVNMLNYILMSFNEQSGDLQNGKAVMSRIRLRLSDEKYIGKPFNNICSELENLLVFNIGTNEYFGFTTFPFLNIYIYDQENDNLDILNKNRIELTLEEVVLWLSNKINTNNYDFNEFIEIISDVYSEF